MRASELQNYKSAEGAARYAYRYETHWHKRMSDRLERRLLRRLLARMDRPGMLLDVPCGTGRLSGEIKEFADRLYESDVSVEMLKQDREHIGDVASGRVAGSALLLPYRNQSFDAVVSIRLTHHLDRSAEVQALFRELTRVSRRWVLVTYFSHSSIKNRLRRVRTRLFGRRPKNTLRHAQVADLARQNGFELVAAPPLSRLFSGHHFALLRRAGSGSAPSA